MIHNRVENHPSYMISSTFNSLHASPQVFLQPSEEERNDSYISTEYTGRTEEPDQSVTLSNDSGLITSNTYLYLENEDLNEDIPSTFFRDHNISENVSVVLPPEKEIEPSIHQIEEKKEEIVEIKTENKEEEPIVSIIPEPEPLEIISKNTEPEIKELNSVAPSPTRMSQHVLREKSSALLSALPVYDSHGSLHISKDLGKKDAKKIKKNQPLSNQVVKAKKIKSVNRLRKLPTIQSGPSSPKVMCGRRFSQNLGDHVSKSKQLQNSPLFPIWNIKDSVTQSHQKQWWTKNYFNRYQSQETNPVSNKHINLHEKTSEDVNVYENRIKKIVSKPPKMPNLSTGGEKKKNESVLLTMMSPYFSTNPKMRLSGKVIKTIGDLIKASQNTRLSTKSNLRTLKKNYTPSNL